MRILQKSLYLSGFIFLLIILFSNSVLADTKIDSSLQQQAESKYEETLWRLGENLNEGDSFVYRICDGIIADSSCYDIKLVFVTILESYKGKTWIAQGIIFDDGHVADYFILQIDPETFEVDSDHLHSRYSLSLENTIFSLAEYQKKSLKTGTVWDSIDSYFTNNVPFEIKNQEIVHTPLCPIVSSVLSYEVIEQSKYFIADSFPFPVKAKLKSPHIIFPEPSELFSFELVAYETVSESVCIANDTKNDTKNDTPNDFENFFSKFGES